jgi:hypothetical protein
MKTIPRAFLFLFLAFGCSAARPRPDTVEVRKAALRDANRVDQAEAKEERFSFEKQRQLEADRKAAADARQRQVDVVDQRKARPAK